MRSCHPGTWGNLVLDFKIVPYREVDEACSELKVRTPEALSDGTRLDAVIEFRPHRTRRGWQQTSKFKRIIREAQQGQLGPPAGSSKESNTVQVPESGSAADRVAIRSLISTSKEFVTS